jgi:hypothetical protein
MYEDEDEDPFLNQFGLPNEYIAPQQPVLRSRTPSPYSGVQQRPVIRSGSPDLVDGLDNSELTKLLRQYDEANLVPQQQVLTSGTPSQYSGVQQSLVPTSHSPTLEDLTTAVDSLDDSELTKLLGPFDEYNVVSQLAIRNAPREERPRQRRVAGSTSKGGKLYKRARKSRKARRTRRARRARRTRRARN